MTELLYQLDALKLQLLQRMNNPECFPTHKDALSTEEIRQKFYAVAEKLGLDRVLAADYLSMPPIQ